MHTLNAYLNSMNDLAEETSPVAGELTLAEIEDRRAIEEAYAASAAKRSPADDLRAELAFYGDLIESAPSREDREIFAALAAEVRAALRALGD